MQLSQESVVIIGLCMLRIAGESENPILFVMR